MLRIFKSTSTAAAELCANEGKHSNTRVKKENRMDKSERVNSAKTQPSQLQLPVYFWLFSS